MRKSTTFPMLVGTYIVVLCASVMAFSAILLIFGVPISPIHLPLAILISGGVFWTTIKEDAKTKLASMGAGLLVMICVGFWASSLYDISYDGNGYHKQSVAYLKNGWNPIYQSSAEFATQNSWVPLDVSQRNALWMEHYPKGSWLFASAVYAITNNVEGAKVLNLSMALACCFMLLGWFQRLLKNFTVALILALLVAFSPIVLIQSFIFYVDGLFATCLYITILSLAIISLEPPQSPLVRWAFVAMFGAVLVAINAKFTGLVFCGLYCCGFYFYWLFKHGFSLKRTLYFVCLVVFSVGVVGFSSYVTNTIDHGHPFYPLMGQGKVDIMTPNQPTYFSEKSSLEKLAISVFSITANIYHGQQESPQLKIPFRIFNSEFRFIGFDTRIGGFGVWFSGILLLGCLALVRIFWWRGERFWVLMLVLGISALLLLIVTDAWWARYSPQLYLVPMVGMVCCFVKPTTWHKILGTLLVIATTVNLAIAFHCTLPKQAQAHKNITQEIEELKNKDITIRLRNDDLVGLICYFKDAGIPYAYANMPLTTNDQPAQTEQELGQESAQEAPIQNHQSNTAALAQGRSMSIQVEYVINGDGNE